LNKKNPDLNIHIEKEFRMAIISMFFGIIVSMYYLDNRQHHAPHIHVKYQEQEAVISIPEGELLQGEQNQIK
jgi:hypothetical protein